MVGGTFGVAGVQVTELFEPVEAAFDHVTVLVDLVLERRRPATGGALDSAPCDLIAAFGTDEPDPPSPQSGPRRGIGSTPCR